MNRLIHGLKPPCPPPIANGSTKSFNSIINRLSSQGAHHQVLQTYASMQKTSTPPDAYTFPSLLKACTILNLFLDGLSLHQSIIVNGFSLDSYIGSSLISFYAKFGCIDIGRKVFDIMPERNVVPWTTIIGCYSREGEIDVAFSMFKQMRATGIQPTSVTLLSLLPSISELPLLQCLHCWIILYGFESNLSLSNSMVNVYGRCGSIEDARSLFESMDYRDIVSWNSLLSAYSKIGVIEEILQLVLGMRTEDIKPDKQTFCSALSASAIKGDIRLGKLVHGLIIKDGLGIDQQVETALMVLYLRCKSLDLALKVFKSTTEKDMVLWTAMISGLVQNDCADKALRVFYQMLESNMEPGTATLASALAACAQLGCYDIGTLIHGYILRQGIMLDIPAQNALVTMYAKCNRLEQSCGIFNKMVERDLVSWNAIVAGHAKNGYLSKAILFFNEMRTSLQRPDSITVTSLLQACGSAGALWQGKWIHNFVFRSSLMPCIMIETALIDMYFKCGNLEIAQKCFDYMPHQDLVTWSTLISGYGFNGNGEIALRKYSEFLGTGLEPNHVIFLSVLSACSHSGLVNQGLRIYESMTRDFLMPPNLEHRACIVDLLSRAGKVEEAYSFYKMMFQEPSIDVLGILLDACRVNGSVELGEAIARDIFALKPVDPGNYVQLAHSYASMGRWDGVEEAWTQMRSLGLKKLPGWSSIEVHGTSFSFYSVHNSHPKIEEIMLTVKSLSNDIRKMHIENEINKDFC
ncbi:pentatricopeptide repeat-containing protein At4g04370 [Momordica charantia]|uniref:Pentatricopeptide repeat-containing protein At4g04370 n=1 Tax=Momordica charantia TaxID=3673 RepID=A0A6J1E522_MOMCH|nr:pentatricopeptide repeat-containing protein At4g04370 [Momordica charantia]XP_022159805.1 pentatricopeptide repeat-containing protein At4g04370 [Momordica charantia]XP_022159806.1 pentatricopeptide repeat-containing protein At4g04370 [Momordica charantia]XP_022159807.1 pentatricopeptide repeat-containing protein At4g04370 [Momordica charantia]